MKIDVYGHYKTNALKARPAIDHHLIEASRVMSAAVSVHLESASPLIDVPTVRDPEIRRVDGSVHQIGGKTILSELSIRTHINLVAPKKLPLPASVYCP